MDPVKKDDQNLASNQTSATPFKEGGSIPAGAIEYQPKAPESTASAEFTPGQISSNPNPVIPKETEKFITQSPSYSPPADISTVQRVSDMGTANIIINAKATFKSGKIEDAATDRAGVEGRQEDREELLKKAA